MSTRLRSHQASRTAEGAAAMRAASCFDRDPRARCPDTLAVRLLPRDYKRLVTSPLIRRLTMAWFRHRLPGLYETHLARTHYFDRAVSLALDEGATQYVLLGAGLDTRPYRLPMGRAVVFEVDHPATSSLKQQRLGEAGLSRDGVRYVTVDFSVEDPAARLMAHGLDPARRTVVTWEGVSMYLDEAAARNIFRLVASLAPGSSVIFDYFSADFFSDPGRYPTAARHLSYVDTLGEPYTFGVAPGRLADVLASAGLTLRDHADAAALESRHLAGRRGVLPWLAIAHATRP